MEPSQLCDSLASGERDLGKGMAHMKLKSLRVFVTVIAAFILCWASASVANALVQGGRYTNNAATNGGSRAEIQANGTSPSSGDCIIYAIVVVNDSFDRQLETGYVRCNGGPGLDGTCDDVKFVEVAVGSAFDCYPHGGFSGGVYHNFRVQRPYGGSPTFIAYIDGSATESVGGIGGNATHWAWAEATPNNVCNGSFGGSATFKNWQKFTYGGPGWSDISGTTYPNCWNVSTINAAKEWHVSH